MDGARRPAWAPDVVRQVLLGLHGPYADPREALDALDNVEALVAELDGVDGIDGIVDLASVLTGLCTDDDPIVATGAILALDVVRRRAAAPIDRLDHLADVVSRMIDLVLADDTRLDRAPTGFNRSTQPTMRAELAVIAARSVSHRLLPVVPLLVERAGSIGVARADLVAALAERSPALVVARAREWVGPNDSAVLARLADHHRRIAVATAVRPWSEQAIRSIEVAGGWQRWHEAELEALVRVMRDDAPELTAPPGVGDADRGQRWWIVAERPWDWTLWRCDDGRAVIELVEGGVGVWTSLHTVSDDAAESIVAASIGGEEPSGRSIIASSPPGSR